MFKTVFIILLLVAFPLIGVGVVISSLGMLGQADASRDWPTADGEILSSEVVKEQVYPRSGPRSGRRSAIDVYSAQVQYEYTVNGQKFRGDRIALHYGPSTDQHHAEIIAERYRPGPVTVYHDPQDPQQAVLAPEMIQGIIPGLVIGGLMIVLPPALILIGLRYQFIERPQLPLYLRLWWNQKFGKPVDERGEAELATRPHASSTSAKTGVADSRFAYQDDFLETVVEWDLKNRVVLAVQPSSIGMYLLLSVLFGAIVAGVGMFPLTHLIFQRETPHFPELGSVAILLFTIFSCLTFFIARFLDRGSRFTVDWNTRIVESKREFAPARQFQLHDVESIIVQPIVVKGRRDKYRAGIELELADTTLMLARTCAPRRKASSAREQATELGQPLADSLGVPIRFEGFDEGRD